MSTRGAVYITKGKDILAGTYNHYDSYPDGLGLDILRILTKENIANIRNNISKVVMHTRDEILEKCFNVAGGKEEYSKLSVDMRNNIYRAVCEGMGIQEYDGENLVQMIADGEAKEILGDKTFVADSVFCEYAYVIDLETNRFEVYYGFNKHPLKENARFKYLEDIQSKENKTRRYYPCRIVVSFDLNNLPDKKEFCDEVAKEEEILLEEDANKDNPNYPMIFKLYNDKEIIEEYKAIDEYEARCIFKNASEKMLEIGGITSLYCNNISVIQMNTLIIEEN